MILKTSPALITCYHLSSTSVTLPTCPCMLYRFPFQPTVLKKVARCVVSIGLHVLLSPQLYLLFPQQHWKVSLKKLPLNSLLLHPMFSSQYWPPCGLFEPQWTTVNIPFLLKTLPVFPAFLSSPSSYLFHLLPKAPLPLSVIKCLSSPGFFLDTFFFSLSLYNLTQYKSFFH